MNSPSRYRGRVAVLSAALAVSVAIFAWMMELPDNSKRSAKGPLPYTISKKTTWITEPLCPDGAVDYVAALNARLSKGVTPQNNAAVLLMQIMGANKIEAEIRKEFYEHLGIPVPANTEGALQSYWDFLGDYLKTREEPSNRKKRQEELNQKSFDTYGHPWTREEFPLVALWLEKNEQAIDLLVAASNRPQLYVPIVLKNENSGLSGLGMSEFTSHVRDFARILCTRFMFSIGEGRFDEAQRDLLACHRLGRLMGSGSSILHYLLGETFDGIARDGDLELAQSKHVTLAQLAKYRVELSKLQPFAQMNEMYDLNERFDFLDLVRILAMDSLKPDAVKGNLAAEVGESLDWPQVKVWERCPHLELDWDLILKIGNSRFDQVVAALKQPTFAERSAGLSKIKAEVMQLRKEALLIAGGKPTREVVSHQFGHELAWMMIENSQLLAESEIRNSVRHQMIIVVLALAEHQRDHGNYPTELSELSPKYLKTIPLDGFTLQPLKYQPQKQGFLLYSVGANGQDDKGKKEYHSPFDEDDGKYYPDDVAIRVPEKKG